MSRFNPFPCERPDVEEARAAAMRIVKDGTRAGEIISRIRLLFKKGTPERELVDVNEVIREVIVLLRGEAIRYNILIRTELAADLPQVMGDRVQLQQVLMNLDQWDRRDEGCGAWRWLVGCPQLSARCKFYLTLPTKVETHE